MVRRQLSPKATMHVMCEGCDEATWFTEEQWELLTDMDVEEDE